MRGLVPVIRVATQWLYELFRWLGDTPWLGKFSPYDGEG